MEAQVTAQTLEMKVPPMIRELHAKALAAAANFKSAEIELLQVLEEVGRHRAFLRYGYNSLFQYAAKALGLSESVAFVFINVARKASEIPELKKEIVSGALSVSKAKKITGVITRENSAAWIELAKNSSQQKLEREVSLANPREAGRGRMCYVAAQNEITERVVVPISGVSRAAAASGAPITDVPTAGVAAPARVQLEVGISEKLMIKIRRAQGLLSQKRRRGAGLEETLEAMVDLYLSKHDPTERAKRQLLRGKLNESPEVAAESSRILREEVTACPVGSTKNKRATAPAELMSDLQVLRPVTDMTASMRTPERRSGKPPVRPPRPPVRPPQPSVRPPRRPLAAATKHRVYLKFESRCSHIDQRGERCTENKFLEVHHLKPLHLGGDDRLENLTLLCSGHHRGIHLGS
ncbi:MAG: HNH endonuclease [Bdellovibrionales bacterium]|nr:HNH endonuclease [Bdellovibrionales bacterium]